jgi:replicative superfamily II helicase
MPKVICIEDKLELVPTSQYPYAKWDFEYFNPIQSRLIDIYASNNNAAIASSTASGKTVSSEMFMAYELSKGKKVAYIAPLKALAKEKEMSWTAESHHFSKYNISILTGDYRLTERRIAELEKSNIIIMTPEMLASRTRNHKSEKSSFLSDIGVVTFDESHLLTVPNRGDHIEIALMKLVEINPDIRIVMLSATMPNVDEICEWVSDLTGRDTYYLRSNYRPCSLHINYCPYRDVGSYDEKEDIKIEAACDLVDQYPDDRFLIFVHTKNTGRKMLKRLEYHGVEAEFHNADLNLKDRLALEDRFRNGGLRAIVATSTLAWGVELPARRVVITGVHRGLEEVENYDIMQEVGRAGRPRYDPRGDAYIFIPSSEKGSWISRLKKPTPIKSVLLNYVGTAENPHYKTLAFHVVSEIHKGNVTTNEGFKEWFKRSLAYHQDIGFDNTVIERTIDSLIKCKAIYEEDGEYRCTPVGIIASMFYFSPFDVSTLKRNFSFLFDKKLENNDYALAMALGNIDSYYFGIVNRQEREEMSSFGSLVGKMFGQYAFSDSAIKFGYAYYTMLKGMKNVPAFQALHGSLLVDLDRTMQVIQAIDSMSAKWNKKEALKTLRLRLLYGVESHLVSLCQIKGIGQVRAKRLYSAGIKGINDFAFADIDYLAGVMKCNRNLVKESVEAAQRIYMAE